MLVGQPQNESSSNVSQEEYMKSKRDKFRVGIRKQKTEQLFKGNRDNSLFHAKNEDMEADEYHLCLYLTRLDKCIETAAWGVGLKIISQITVGIKNMYQYKHDLCMMRLNLLIEQKWQDKLLLFMHQAKSSSDLHQVYQVCIQLLSVLSSGDLGLTFECKSFLTTQFFQVFLETREPTLFGQFLILLLNLAQDERCAHDMIFDCDIAEQMSQAMELQLVIMEDIDVRNQWLQLLKNLLQHEFDGTYTLFKENIWFASQLASGYPDSVILIYYAFTQNLHQQQRACDHLYQLDGVLEFIYKQAEDGGLAAIKLINNMLLYGSERTKSGLLKQGILKRYNYILSQDSNYVIPSLLFAAQELAASNDPDVIDQMTDSDFLVAIFHLRVQTISVESQKLLLGLLRSLSKSTTVRQIIYMLQHHPIGQILKDILCEQPSEYIITSVLQIFEQINRRLDAMTPDYEPTILDRIIQVNGIDRILENSLKQIKDPLLIEWLQRFLDRLQFLK